MEKKTTKEIKEIIQDLLSIRRKSFIDHINSLESLYFKLDIETNSELYDQMDQEQKLMMEEVGISQEDLDELNEITRPSEKELQQMIDSDFEDKKHIYSDIWNEYSTNFDESIIRLNNLLEKADQLDQVNEMTLINTKEYLTRSEFHKRYGIGRTTQDELRMRNEDPLPYVQLAKPNGTIKYRVEDVEIWIRRNA